MLSISKNRLRRRIEELESELIRLLSVSGGGSSELPPDDQQSALPLSQYHRLDFLKNLLYAEFASDPNRLSEIEHAFRGWENDHAAAAAAPGGPTCCCTDSCGHNEDGEVFPGYAGVEGDDQEEVVGVEGRVVVESKVAEEEINRGEHPRKRGAVAVEGWGNLIRRFMGGRSGGFVIGVLAGAAALVALGLFVRVLRYDLEGGGDILHTPT